MHGGIPACPGRPSPRRRPGAPGLDPGYILERQVADYFVIPGHRGAVQQPQERPGVARKAVQWSPLLGEVHAQAEQIFGITPALRRHGLARPLQHLGPVSPAHPVLTLARARSAPARRPRSRRPGRRAGGSGARSKGAVSAPKLWPTRSARLISRASRSSSRRMNVCL